MAIPELTPYPDPAPSRSNPPDVFIERANSHVAHDEVLVDEWNNDIVPAFNADVEAVTEAATTLSGASVAAVASTDYAASSASTVAVSAGTKTVVLAQSGKAFAIGDAIAVISRSDPETRLLGSITNVATTTLTVSVPADGVFGSGSPSSWLVIHQAFLGAGATAAMLWEGLSDEAPVSPATFVAASEPQTLADGATISWNVNLGWNAKVTLGGNRTLAAPTNLKVGQTYVLEVIQDATGSRTLSWNSAFDFGAGGTPVLSTGASKRDIFFFYCYDAATPKLRATASFSA